jgi:hypothetical protein
VAAEPGVITPRHQAVESRGAHERLGAIATLCGYVLPSLSNVRPDHLSPIPTGLGMPTQHVRLR